MVKICSEHVAPESHDVSIDESYGFSLSNFQKHAIEAIHTGNHVLITAHTGSGKTLPAEYAIKYFVAKGKKVVYTSPIKALSNQKYHEFTEKYPDISFGILTGDIKFNPEADVLIMTTEILRNQIFHSAFNKHETQTALSFDMNIEEDLGCVVFDEVHYINDKERGKIWEETILHLPKSVQMVMLSATIDKAEKFAEWVETRNDERCVYLASTFHRVVPLYHHGYITLHESYTNKIKDAKLRSSFTSLCGLPKLLVKDGKFDESELHRIQQINTYVKKQGIHIKRSFVLNSLVLHLHKNNLLPGIVFIFSRAQVEKAAAEINFSLFDQDSKVPSIIEHECEMIIRRLPNHKEYLELSEFREIVKLLQKGIAFHHAGMLPVFREMIELLFAKNYIKLLVATETFAVGINMPTKTVVFTSLKKFDGTSTRPLHPHEYTQMAGRAGRRGIDSEGHVIHCNNLFDDVSSSDYKNILCGSPQKIISKFSISYSLVLNLIANDYSESNKLAQFTEKSLMKTEIDKHIDQVSKEISELETSLSNKERCIDTLRTPYDVCKEYLHLMNDPLPNKERKKASKRISEIKEEYRFLISDTDTITQINAMHQELESKKVLLSGVRDYADQQIEVILNVLEERGFIQYIDEEHIVTTKGVLSSHIQEIPGHIFSELIMKHHFFEKHDAKIIASIFSCFTNIICNDSCRRVPHDVDIIVKDLDGIVNSYYDVENANKIDVCENYAFHTNIVNEVIDWCDAENEEECKQIISSLCIDKGIFLGDFIKAILKINNIANELLKLNDLPVSFQHKLSSICGMTQKYVVTNQSLYI